MQIRFATMGKKNKHERNPTKSTVKVWNPKKEKNHKTKRQICNNCFFGALLCLPVLQLIMQIRFATTRKKKNISEALRKTQKKSGTLRKKRTTKQKDKFANTVFLALLSNVPGDYANQIYNDGEEEKKIRETLMKNTEKSPEP
jgi:hypothetical protein